MREYLVLVEAEDYINVEAENEEDAKKAAIAAAYHEAYNWKATVLDEQEIE